MMISRREDGNEGEEDAKTDDDLEQLRPRGLPSNLGALFVFLVETSVRRASPDECGGRWLHPQ